MSLHHRIARPWLVATETKVNLMKSFLIDRYTKGGALRLGESPEPELRENDVIVEIHAAGGVGTIAIQLAKHLGAYVATTTSTANIALVKSLGADVVVDYKNDDFEKVLQGYDVVLNSLGKDTLEKSLGVMKPGGKLISISGPPDPDFARENGSGWLLQQVMRLLSSGIRRKSKHRRISYSFLFMTANGGQLRKITSLIGGG